MTATITRNGTYSGRVKLGGGSYSISGKMNLLCQATNRIKRGTSFLTTVMQADQAGQIFGQVAQDSWTAPAASFPCRLQRQNQSRAAGRPLHDDVAWKAADPILPSGHSYGTVPVAASGLVSFAGALAAGSKVTQSAYLSKDGLWPFYLPLYSSKGIMVSWQTFRTQSDTDFDGWMVWIKPTNSASKFYPAGFDYEPQCFWRGLHPAGGNERDFQFIHGIGWFCLRELAVQLCIHDEVQPGNKVSV